MQPFQRPARILALLPLVLFAPLALGQRVFVAQDLQAYFYPYHLVGARFVAAGHWPLWNPYVFCGIPLLGDGQTAMFYPPNWLFFLLPGPTGLNLIVLMQFSLAGAGMYLFARVLGLSRTPAFLAGLSYMFCGFLTARVVHLSIMSGAALIPWIFLCADRLITRGFDRRWFAATSVALASQAVAGHPQIPIYTGIALLLYAITRGVEHRSPDGRWRLVRPAALMGGAYLLGYALAAIQLLPWFELARLSNRAAGTTFEFVFGTSTHGAEWLLFLLPYVLGAPGSSLFGTAPVDIERAVRIWEHSAYVGVLPLALAAVGLGHLGELLRRRLRQRIPDGRDRLESAEERRRRYSLAFLALLVGVGLLMASGWHTPFAHVLYSIPAIGRLRAVERALVLAVFALPLMAGFGFQRVIDGSVRTRWLLLPAVLILAIPLFFVWQAQELSFDSPAALVPLLFAFASCALLAWWSQRGAGMKTRAVALSLVAVDMALYAATFTPTADASLYHYRPPSLHVLGGHGEPFRTATVLRDTNDLDVRVAQDALAMSWGMVYGIEDINGFNSLQPRRYTDYLFGPGEMDVSYGYLRHMRLFDPRSPILASLNVRYVLVPSGNDIPLGPHLQLKLDSPRVRVYENERAYPRAYFVDRVEAEQDPVKVLRRVRAMRFDGRRRAIVESPAPPMLPRPRHDAHAKVSRAGPNTLQVETTTGEARFLVVSEMFIPGWDAYIDGRETTTYRTNYLFRGVVVPAGRHTVTFVYRPVSVVLGTMVSAIALIAVGALLTRGAATGKAGG